MESLAGDVDLAETYWQQVRIEFREATKPPFEIIFIILFNVALVLICWFLINPELIARHTGLIFLPGVLASWAFCDVPATNLYGADPKRFLAILDDERAVRREFMVKNFVLWLLISPACVALSLVLAPTADEWSVSISIAIAVMSMPFGYLGISSIMAPLLPFHKMPWRMRLHRRDTWLRWGTALIAPYVLATPAALVTILPAGIFFFFFGDDSVSYFIGALLITPWAFVVWQVMLRVTYRITQRRRKFLLEFLAHPNRG